MGGYLEADEKEKSSLSHVNAHQKAFSTEDALNNQVATMTRYIDVFQSP